MLDLFDSISPFDDALSKHLEQIGYESLWLENNKTSFKSIATTFANNTINSFADFVQESEYQKLYNELKHVLKKANIEQDAYGIKLSQTYDFPEQLKDLKYPLGMLYYQGDWNLAFSRCIAIVGTKKPTLEAQKNIKKLVPMLVNNGYTIVSGLAGGVDTLVHQTAINCGGKTIAVLGTPITRFYPKKNRTLQEKIAREHLLISQVPIIKYEKHPSQDNKFFFPERNATMSALCLGSIIIEAGEKSGTLIQAKHAIKQKRHLFILNSCFENTTLTWPKKFQEKGAIRVYKYNDIIEMLKND